MKNPHITTRLNMMMQEEKKQRLEAIGTIIEHKLVRNPQTDVNELFNSLYELHLDELNNILSDIISELYAECNKFVTGL